MTSRGLEAARLLAASSEWGLTVGAGGALGVRSGGPLSGRRGQGGLLEQLGAQASEARIDGSLDLCQSCLGMLQAPLLHPSHDLLADCSPVLLVGHSILHARSLRCYDMYLNACNSSCKTISHTLATSGVMHVFAG